MCVNDVYNKYQNCIRYFMNIKNSTKTNSTNNTIGQVQNQGNNKTLATFGQQIQQHKIPVMAQRSLQRQNSLMDQKINEINVEIQKTLPSSTKIISNSQISNKNLSNKTFSYKNQKSSNAQQQNCIPQQIKSFQQAQSYDQEQIQENKPLISQEKQQEPNNQNSKKKEQTVVQKNQLQPSNEQKQILNKYKLTLQKIINYFNRNKRNQQQPQCQINWILFGAYMNQLQIQQSEIQKIKINTKQIFQTKKQDKIYRKNWLELLKQIKEWYEQANKLKFQQKIQKKQENGESNKSNIKQKKRQGKSQQKPYVNNCNQLIKIIQQICKYQYDKWYYELFSKNLKQQIRIYFLQHKREYKIKCKQQIESYYNNISNDIPFYINGQQCLSHSKDSHIYKCKLINPQTILVKPEQFYDYYIQTITQKLYRQEINQNQVQLKYKQYSELLNKKKFYFQDQTSTYNQKQLKCKIIPMKQNYFLEQTKNIAQIKAQQALSQQTILNKYFYLLKTFYSNKHYLKPNTLFKSANSIKKNQSLKFAILQLELEIPDIINTSTRSISNNQSQSTPTNNQGKKLQSPAQNINNATKFKSDKKQITDLVLIKKQNKGQISYYKYKIIDFRFSLTQNSVLNTYFDSIDNSQQQRVKQIQLSKSKKNNFYIVGQYYHGHTLKQLILHNWKGLYDHKIVNKIVRKLFWNQVQLQAVKFDFHIPTLENVIIDDNQNSPDLYINMLSFIGSTFLYSDQSGLKISKKNYQQFLPFMFKQQFKQQFQQNNKINFKQTSSIKINRIKHFLTILLFIISKRLDFFQSSQDKLIECIKQLLKPKLYHQKLLQSKKKALQEQQSKQLQKQKQIIQKKEQTQNFKKQQRQNKFTRKEDNNIQVAQQTKLNQNIINFNEIINQMTDKSKQVSKINLLNILQVVPGLYKKFLQEPLIQKTDKKVSINAFKTNNFPRNRIKQYEKQINLKGNILLQLIQTELTKGIQQLQNKIAIDGLEVKQTKIIQNANKSTSQQKASATWRNLYYILFLQGQEKIILQSQLLILLCSFYSYPLQQKSITTPSKGNWIPPQIYFAFKFDIDVQYFCTKFQNKWFNCFQHKSKQKQIKYDPQVICLLKNIEKQVIEEMTQLMKRQEKMLYKWQRMKIEGSQKQKQIATQKIQIQSKIITQKVHKAQKLIDYLNSYQRKVYTKKVQSKQSMYQKLKTVLQTTRKSKEETTKIQDSQIRYFSYQYFQNNLQSNLLGNFQPISTQKNKKDIDYEEKQQKQEFIHQKSQYVLNKDQISYLKKVQVE